MMGRKNSSTGRARMTGVSVAIILRMLPLAQPVSLHTHFGVRPDFSVVTKDGVSLLLNFVSNLSAGDQMLILKQPRLATRKDFDPIHSGLELRSMAIFKLNSMVQWSLLLLSTLEISL